MKVVAEEEVSDGSKRMSKEFFKQLLRNDHKLYYTTESLNDILYLHFKGFTKIENMEGFTGVKCLYMESNGLDNCKMLRSLYIHQNLVRKIEGLSQLHDLAVVNLSDNAIQTIEGFEGNPNLETLLLKRNHIGINGPSDYEYLCSLKNVTVLDISHNKIDHEDAEEFIKILEQMDKLSTKKIENYRKVLTARLKNLKYLDDRPVFPEDRRFSEAFYTGGLEAERLERQRFKEEENERREENRRNFQEFIDQAKREREEKESEAQVREISLAESEEKNLETYYSDSKEGDSRKAEDKSSLNKSESKSIDHSDSEEKNTSSQEEISERKIESKVIIEFTKEITELD